MSWIEYEERFKRSDWQMLRRRKLREQPFCAMCGKDDETLDVHHNNYKRFGRERMSDLVVICRECHELHHQHYGRWRRAQ